MPPSIRYMNQSAPFWDFVSSLEEQGTSHPFFNNLPYHGHGPNNNNEPAGPSTQHDEKRDVNMEGDSDSDTLLQQTPGPDGEKGEKAKDGDNDDDKKGKHPCGDGANRRGGPCGARGRGFHGHGRGRGPCGRRGGGPAFWGPRGGWWANGMPGAFPGAGGPGGPFNPLAHLGAFFNGQAPGADGASQDPNAAEFRPEADVFDTDSAYIIHVSLPGAKKEDVGVSWDAERSEVLVSGVAHRPGVDEDMLKNLALDERRCVGMFERRIRLGTRASPAQVDGEGVSARFEDGILVVEVPKVEKEGFVQVRKVDVL